MTRLFDRNMKRSTVALLAAAIAFSSLFAFTPARALYDPKPVEPLAQFEGAWTGSLTYKDYQDPTRQVTLPTQMFVALAEPGKLALHYVYDDGPKKIVHSYEALSIDLAAKTAFWTEELNKPPVTYRVISAQTNTGTGELVLVLEADATDPKKPALAQERIEIGLNNLRFERRTGASQNDLSFVHSYIFSRAK